MIIPSTEQAAPLFNPAPKMVMLAFAGAGKTTLLEMYARQFSHKRCLLISYNRAIRNEAKEKLKHLPNIKCLTAHQLAYEAAGYRYENKLADNLRLFEVKTALRLTDWKTTRLVSDTLFRWFCSDAKTIELEHTGARLRTRSQRDKAKLYTELATKLWTKMVDLNDPTPMTHDGYLKGFSLGCGSMHNELDVILIDEGQDLSPVIQSIIDQQNKLEVVYVGDRHQQINRWRGAENSLDKAIGQGAKVFPLTHSYRFGPEIASVANSILFHKREPLKLVGAGEGDGFAVTQSLNDLLDGVQTAYLSRTYISTIENALGLLSQGIDVAWVGGVDGYNFNGVFNVIKLFKGDHQSITDRAIKNQFHNYSEYEQAAKKSKDLEMTRIVTLISRYGIRLESMLSALKASALDITLAKHIVGTTHRSKGLGFEQVVLCDDFPDIEKLVHKSQEEIDDELNLIYVGVTRAKRRLVLNDFALGLIERAKDLVRIEPVAI